MIAHGRAPFCGLVCRVESVPREKPSHVEPTITPNFAPHAAAPLSEPATCAWATTDSARRTHTQWGWGATGDTGFQRARATAPARARSPNAT